MPWPFQSPWNLPEVHLNLCTLRWSLVVASMWTKNNGSTFCLKQPGCLICKTFENQSKTTLQTRTSPSIHHFRGPVFHPQPAHQMSWIGLFPADKKWKKCQGNIWVTNLFHDVSLDSIIWSFQQILRQISANRNQVARQVSHKKKLYIYVLIYTFHQILSG